MWALTHVGQQRTGATSLGNSASSLLPCFTLLRMDAVTLPLRKAKVGHMRRQTAGVSILWETLVCSLARGHFTTTTPHPGV